MINLKELFLEKYQKYIVIDTEACNLNIASKNNLPWQVSWIECSGKNILKEENHYLWWKDGLDMSEGAKIVTHFDYNYYKNLASGANVPFTIFESGEYVEKGFEDPKEIAQLLYNRIFEEGFFVIWQNGLRYDAFVIKNWFEKVGISYNFDFLEKSIDTNFLSRAYKEEIKFPRDGELKELLEWQFKLANHIRKGVKTSIAVMCKELDIPIDNSKQHNALYDILMTKEIFIKLIYKLS